MRFLPRRDFHQRDPPKDEKVADPTNGEMEVAEENNKQKMAVKYVNASFLLNIWETESPETPEPQILQAKRQCAALCQQSLKDLAAE